MNTIDPTNYTAHKHPGKFEGETAATEYFYEQMLNGDGEEIFASKFDDISDADMSEFPEYSATIFHINADEAEAFGLPIGHWFLLREDSQGFAYGSVHETRKQAERKFRDWLGL